jgi:2,3-bisphosphoglycerate-independent phosphoglycerate mutase
MVEVTGLFSNLQSLNSAIRSGEFFQHPELLEMKSYLRLYTQQLHLLGLVSQSKKLADLDHWLAALKFCQEHQITSVAVHAITDGLDMPATSAAPVLDFLATQMRNLQIGRIASITGRYYLLNPEIGRTRLETAVKPLIHGQERSAPNYQYVLMQNYQKGITDEFIEPTLLETHQVENMSLIHPGDIVWLMNHDTRGMVELADSLGGIVQVKIIRMTKPT